MGGESNYYSITISSVFGYMLVYITETVFILTKSSLSTLQICLVLHLANFQGALWF